MKVLARSSVLALAVVVSALTCPMARAQTVLYTFNGDSAGAIFGVSVSGAGDVNGDGFDDLIVGAPRDDNNGSNSGSARVFSGVDGSVLYTFHGDSVEDRFGVSVSGAGDVNGDGFDDLIVGAYYDDNNGPQSGSARVFSGVDGSTLYTFNGDSWEDLFGFSVSGAGDVNGDGFDDLIVGASGDDNNGINSGSARVFSGFPGQSYCSPAIPNSTGLPGNITATGSSPLLVHNDLTLTADQLPPGQFGYFLTSQTQGFFMPPGSSGFICLGGNIGRYNGNVGQGPTFSLQLDLTSMPVNPPVAVQPGDTWNFQAWFRDTIVGFPTSNFTDGVSILFQ